MNHLGLKCKKCKIEFSESDLSVMEKHEFEEKELYCDVCAMDRFDYEKHKVAHEERMANGL